MWLRVMARSRSITLLALVIVIGLPTRAQRVGAVRGWFSTPGCASDIASEPTIGSNDGAIDRESGLESFAERASAIAESLPTGRAQELVQELVRSLAPRNHLKYVCKDESETGYVIRYPEGLGTDFVSGTKFAEFPFELSNLGRPEIEFTVDADPREGIFIYSYHVSNGIGATRPIRRWTLVADADDQSLRLEHPANWNSHVPTERSAVAPQAALYKHLSGPELMRREPLGYLAVWAGLGNVIDPGETVGTFTAISRFRPGWTAAYLNSKGVNYALPFSLGEFPKAVQEEILFLKRWENERSSVLVIGPRFGADATRETVTANWQTGIRTLIAHGWLLENSPYVAELLQALNDASQVDVGASVRSEPMEGMESLLDKIVRLAF